MLKLINIRYRRAFVHGTSCSLFLTVVCIYTLFFSISNSKTGTAATEDEAESKIDEVEENDEFCDMEEFYKPPQPFVFPEFLRIKEGGSGLANWTRIEEKLDIKKVRLVVAPPNLDTQRWEFETENPTEMQIFQQALTWGEVRRYGLSDFANWRSGFFDTIVAVLILFVEEKPLVIGVTDSGFYFGARRGGSHQYFESWLLAKAIDDIFLKQTGEGLPEKVFKILSGEKHLEDQKRYYDKHSMVQSPTLPNQKGHSTKK